MSLSPIEDSLTIAKSATMAQNRERYPVSSNSRTKLNAFRYDDIADERSGKSPSKIHPQPGHSDKENQTSWLNGVVGPFQSRSGIGDPLSQAREPKQTKDCPQTPARIPLADLISSTEDAVVQDPAAELTPEDHVIWQHVPASSSTDAKSRTPATNSKKRRHSSSPTCSPLTENSKSARKEPFDLQSFQALLKTPQNDMATDLWNSYVEKHKANGNGNLQLPRFDNLLSSSPQTPATAKTSRDSSGLRRSISCNAEWPTSRTKRRRMNDDDSKTARGLFSRTKSNVLDSGNSKSSRINFLMDQIEKSLQKPSEGPSSSSPVPEHKDGVRSRSASPIERRALRASEKSNYPVDERSEVCKDQNSFHGSSEFEDEEFDQDLLDFATSMGPFVEPPQPTDIQLADSKHGGGPASNEYQHQQTLPGQCGTNSVTQNPERCTITRDNENDIDEFEDDYDGLPDNLEQIAAKYDETPVSDGLTKATENDQLASKLPSLTSAEAPIKAEKTQGMSSSDEFDDDDFDLEAIEQSMKQPGEYGSDHVCHS